jgi:hypothetical protein
VLGELALGGSGRGAGEDCKRDQQSRGPWQQITHNAAP